MYTGYFHIKGYLMSHHLAGATNQVANLVKYNCHTHDNGNKGQHKMCWYFGENILKMPMPTYT